MSTTTEQNPKIRKALVPLSEDRFKTAKWPLIADKFMTHFIKIGGIGIIAAVIGIFVFIVTQTLPLFEGAKVSLSHSYDLPREDYVAMGVDEWSELPFFIDSQGSIKFFDLEKKQLTKEVHPFKGRDFKMTSFYYSSKHQEIIYGTSEGSFFLAKILYQPNFKKGVRNISATVEVSDVTSLEAAKEPIKMINFDETSDSRIVATVHESAKDEAKIQIRRYVKETTLFGEGELVFDQSFDISKEVIGRPKNLLVNANASGAILTVEGGQVYYFRIEGDKIALAQVFQPFAELDNPEVGSVDFLFGDVSLVFTSQSGVNRVYSLFIPKGGSVRKFGQTKEFSSLEGSATFFDVSLRNKAFLLGKDSFASIRYVTTEMVRWEERLPFEIKLAILGTKYNKILFLDQDTRLHVYELRDPHPEAGFKAYFQKIWYEGYNEAVYAWQSTGGTSEFEPKLSLIPLIIGTLKGTFYAMMFALPIALIAALYTSQFAHPRFKLFIKPAMEIMASLPSVVLGFLAALWLAPLIDAKVPSLLMIFIMIPMVSLLAGSFWTSLPIQYRKRVKSGYEWIVMIPILFATCWLGWVLGPWLEKTFFTIQDPSTGQVIADFRLWWTSITGLAYEQRNSLVVGFMMGFAVIPIVFTIAEDSLSNVPQTLTSASLALGASRWQTAFFVVLPTAFPGIFSAIMIGLGRAIGETMIVVMATGNTPIMDMNIFSGMRTLSANIAVELPEAPHFSTLYRTLFLGAVVLFMMTFIMNTFAEIIRQKIREKYKTI